MKYQHTYLFFLMIILLAGCTGFSGDGAGPQPTLSINDDIPVDAVTELSLYIGAFPTAIDPIYATLGNPIGMDLIGNTLTTLTEFDTLTGEAQPSLAEDWSVTTDGLTWTFSLREDWPWVVSDASGVITQGDFITPEDVVSTFERLCRYTGPADMPDILKSITGCMELTRVDNAGDVAFGVTASDHQVVFSLKHPVGEFPAALAMPVFSILPAARLSSDVDWSLPAEAWASGPYVVYPQSTLDGITTFVRNPYFPLAASVSADRIIHRGDLTAEEAFSLWQEGELDVVLVTGDYYQSVESETALQTCGITTFAAFLYDVQPFSLAGIREGLARGIDQEALLGDTLVGNFGPCQVAVPAHTLSPYASGLQLSWLYDPEEALLAMNDYGYYACSSIYPQAVAVDEASPAVQDLAGRVFESLESSVSCRDTTFVLDPVPMFELVSRAGSIPGYYDPPRPGISFITWAGEGISLDYWTTAIHGCRDYYPDALLDQNRECTETDMLLSDATRQSDASQREALYEQAFDSLFSAGGEFPVIPLVHWARAFAHHGAMSQSALDGLYLAFDTLAVGDR